MLSRGRLQRRVLQFGLSWDAGHSAIVTPIVRNLRRVCSIFRDAPFPQTRCKRARPSSCPVAGASSCPAGRTRRSRSRGGQQPGSEPFSRQTHVVANGSLSGQPHFCVPDQGAEELRPAPERTSYRTSAPAPGTTSRIIGGACARSSMVKSWDCGGGAQWRVTSRRHDAGEHSRYVEPGAAAIEYFVMEAARRATAF